MYRIVNGRDDTHPDRHRIAVCSASDLVLDLLSHDTDGDREQVGLTRYTPTSDTQHWQFQHP